MRSFAGAFPFVQNPAPDRAENDDAGHVQGPGAKIIFAHFNLAHRIKEKLKIPAGAGQGAKSIIAQ